MADTSARRVAGKMRAAVERVTPEIAKRWLKLSTGNRRISEGWVENLARSIRAGDWVVSHQGIAFDDAGALIDGHHRLLAVIMSGTPIDLVVHRGAPVESRHVLDQGKKRDLSALYGYTPIESKIARCLASVVAGRVSVTPGESRRILELSLVKDAIACLVSAAPASRRVISSAPVISAAVARMIGDSVSGFVISQYRALTIRDYERMTPHSRAFTRLIDKGTVDSVRRKGTEELFVRALNCFDIAQQSRTVSVWRGTSAMKAAREYTRSALGILAA